MLPKDAKQNFIVCATDTNSVSEDFQGVIDKMAIGSPKIITFQNSSYQELKEQPDEDLLDLMELSYRRT